MGEKNDYIPEGEFTEPKTDQLLRFICHLVLKDSKVTKRVGVFGSYARGKVDPGDIDLAYFVDDEVAVAFLEDAARGNGEKTAPKYLKWAKDSNRDPEDEINYSLYFLTEILQMDNNQSLEFLYRLKLVQEIIKKPIQEVIISNNPSSKFILLTVSNQRDPCFLQNLAKDIKLLNPETNEFAKTEDVYPPEIMKEINETAFYWQKALMSGDELAEELLDDIEKSPRQKD